MKRKKKRKIEGREGKNQRNKVQTYTNGKMGEEAMKKGKKKDRVSGTETRGVATTKMWNVRE